jgi:predicted N-acetyltransferase YhbS
MPFWYDEDGPVAAALVNSWSSATWLDLITLPSVNEAMIREVFERGLALTATMQSVEMLVDDGDTTLIGLLRDAGFHREPGDVTAWIDAATIPPISALAPGYSLHRRATSTEAIHHFAGRNGPDAENRLRQTSLYRPDLDLFVVDEGGEVAAYGLFWHDPVTGVGLVEPIRTEQPHQGKGLARHIVTTGLHELAAAGSRRIKVSYDGDDPAAVGLYLGVGFEPAMTCSMWSSTAN